MEYTLQQAAELLGMDIKSLKQYCLRAGITPRPDVIDRRRRLLSQEEYDRILCSSTVAIPDQVPLPSRRSSG